MKVFFDTNVLIDVLAKRQPFYQDSAALWSFAELGRLEGFVSAVSFTTIYYVLRKLADVKTAQQTLVLLRDIFDIASCDSRVLNQSIDAGFKDFEDAVQYFSALQVGAESMITRNPDHFPRSSSCPVLTPAEFLAAHFADQ